jgi:glycerol-3-phosphate dehydrogenase
VIRRPLVHQRALAVQTKYRDPNAVLSRGPRHLFLVPWRDVTLIGVNSVIYRGDPTGLTVAREEVQGFLDEINHAEPALALTSDDVALVLAGLLPIDAANLVNGEVSFGKRPLIVDNARCDGVEGLITAVTNRYTTARLVAERAVDLVFRKLGKEVPGSQTAEIPLHGGDMDSLADLVREVVQRTGDHRPDTAEQLARNHGSAYGDVHRVVSREPQWGETIGTSPTLKAEVIHAVREEMAAKLADCVFRRTNLGTAGDPGPSALRTCAELMAGELGWSRERMESEVAEVQTRFPGAATSTHIL